MGRSQAWGDHLVSFPPERVFGPPNASYRPANPSFSVDELVYQLNTTKTSLLFAHSSVLKVALEPAKVSGIPADRIVLIDTLQPIPAEPLVAIGQLVNEGGKLSRCFAEKQLRRGEGKIKVAVRREHSLPFF